LIDGFGSWSWQWELAGWVSGEDWLMELSLRKTGRFIEGIDKIITKLFCKINFKMI
jgi:hypothetical protein